MKIFITGISGLVGSYLCEYLIKCFPKYKIYGLVRPGSNLNNITHLKNRVNLFEGDIFDYKKIIASLKLVKPQWIFHLAAKISSRYTKEAFEQLFETNTIGTFNLLKAVKDYAPEAKIFVASSAAVYGNVAAKYLPIKETQAVDTIDIYGASKACSEILSKQYYRTFGLKVVIARTFNFLAPARGHTFIEDIVLPQIKSIKIGKSKPIIKIGNFNNYRDFIDVRDAVRAYVALIMDGQSGEVYNVCSNKMTSVKHIFDLLLQKIGLRNKVKILINPRLVRSIDVKKSMGSNSKIVRQTSWRPEILTEQTLTELLENENLFFR